MITCIARLATEPPSRLARNVPPTEMATTEHRVDRRTVLGPFGWQNYRIRPKTHLRGRQILTAFVNFVVCFAKIV